MKPARPGHPIITTAPTGWQLRASTCSRSPSCRGGWESSAHIGPQTEGWNAKRWRVCASSAPATRVHACAALGRWWLRLYMRTLGPSLQYSGIRSWCVVCPASGAHLLTAGSRVRVSRASSVFVPSRTAIALLVSRRLPVPCGHRACHSRHIRSRLVPHIGLMDVARSGDQHPLRRAVHQLRCPAHLFFRVLRPLAWRPPLPFAPARTPVGVAYLEDVMTA